MDWEIIILTERILSKDKIIQAAIELINDRETITFTKLGRKLNMRSQGIYNYYPNVMAVRIAVTVKFYDNLAVRLQADLLGLTGKVAIKAFANIIVHYALDNFRVAQQILSIPAENVHDKNLETSLLNIIGILNQFLDPLEKNEEDRLVISRALRNLAIGQIVQVGNNQFVNQTLSAQDSFDEMLEMILSNL